MCLSCSLIFNYLGKNHKMKTSTNGSLSMDPKDNLYHEMDAVQAVIDGSDRKKGLYTILDEALRNFNVLPQKNEDPVKGSELINRLRPFVSDAFSDSTIRTYLSHMSKNENSPIAKADRGHGYYFRLPIDGNFDTYSNMSKFLNGQDSREDIAKRDAQDEEKFRALQMIYLNSENEFPASVEHTKALRGMKGKNIWKYPDVVSIDWNDGILTPIGDKFYLDKNMIEMKLGLGNSLFEVKSFELKMELNWNNYKNCFFQCLSNSSWANTSHLGVALKVSDQELVKKLKKLGSKHGVSIICFNISESDFDDLPSADVIRNLSKDEKEILLDKYCCNIYNIYEQPDSVSLDWEEFNDLCILSFEFTNIKKWISRCKIDQQAYSLKDFMSKENEEYELNNIYSPQAYRH